MNVTLIRNIIRSFTKMLVHSLPFVRANGEMESTSMKAAKKSDIHTHNKQNEHERLYMHKALKKISSKNIWLQNIYCEKAKRKTKQ